MDCKTFTFFFNFFQFLYLATNLRSMYFMFAVIACAVAATTMIVRYKRRRLPATLLVPAAIKRVIAGFLTIAETDALSKVDIGFEKALDSVFWARTLGDCDICWEPLNSRRCCILNCGHFFHAQCVGEWCTFWLKNSSRKMICPLCFNGCRMRLLNNKVNT